MRPPMARMSREHTNRPMPAPLADGDEIQIGKYKLSYLEK